MKTLKLNKYYEVKWIDAAASEGWRSTSDPMISTLKVITVGQLIKVDKGCLVLALNKDENGNVCETMSIPQPIITKVRRLK